MTPQPDFLVIGAPKCGTTSVYHYLRQHPQVFLCPKETHYFVRDDPGYASVQTRSWEAYTDLFTAAEPEQKRGEVAVRYLYSENSLNEIHERLPQCRLIAFVREPVARTISQYLMRFRTGGSKASDGGVLPNEADIREYFSDLNRDIVHWSEYHRYLCRWFDKFPAEQIRVFLLEELETQPEETMRQVCEFIGVDPQHRIDATGRYNVSTSSDFNPLLVRLKRIKLLRQLRNSRSLRALARMALPRTVRDHLIWRPQKAAAHISEKISIPEDVRESLFKHFAAQREQLQDLTGIDCSQWDSGRS